MKVTTASSHVVRIAGVIALALGVALWNGRLYNLLGAHMALGIAAIGGLWLLAILALRRGVPPGMPNIAFLWGLANPRTRAYSDRHFDRRPALDR